MKVLLSVAYDGSNYYGWQRQNDFITVQQKVEEAISALMKKPVAVRGASRTDTGVHAMCQGVVFETETTIPVEKMPYAINSFLPNDIVVNGAREVGEEFHPQYSVIDKTYEYKIQNCAFRNPLLYNYTDFVHYKLDIDKMNEACQYFIGEHDFNAFCASGSQTKTTVRTIDKLNVRREKEIVTISVTGSGFLYNMVRILTGTLVEVGLGKTNPDDMPKILEAKDRSKSGATLPPRGLILVNVEY